MIHKTFVDLQHSLARCPTANIFSAGKEKKKKKENKTGETRQQGWELSVSMSTYFFAFAWETGRNI